MIDDAKEERKLTLAIGLFKVSVKSLLEVLRKIISKQ